MRYASLYVLDENNRILHLQQSNHSFPVDKIVSLNKKPEPPMVLAVRSKKLILADDIKKHKYPKIRQAERPFAGNYDTNSCIIAPLICKDRVVGVLNFADKQKESELGCNDVALVELFSQLVGESIGNIRLFERIQKQATTDGLTSLANYRTFYRTLEKEMWRSRRYNERVSIIMVDIDNLKRINDKYGHRAGDEVIRQVSRQIQGCVRHMDTPARYGGDEFAIILPNTSISEAKLVASRMVENVAKTKLKLKNEDIPLSISVGLGEYGPESSPTDMTHYSDQALYLAKKAGKNTFRIFEKV
jgi:diguanylate cyclase (GGDEF)-like protein